LKHYNRKFFLIQRPDFFKKNKKRVSLYRLARKLAEGAMMEDFCGNPTRRKVEDAVRTKTPIPKRCKPGGRIKELSREERELVKELKSKHFNNRFLD